MRTHTARRTGQVHFCLVLALVFTFLNAIKPLQVDDAAYYYFAAHIACRPTDPYGFDILWYDVPQPANTVLAPPVLPYWWAGGILVFGEQPFFWKLWLLPFSLLLVTALGRLFRRYARGLEWPLLILTVLSPMFLPSLNLMLDVPALALGLFALTEFLRACDRTSPALAGWAGLLAGMAMQTKYTALLVPVVMVLAAVVYGRLRLGILAAAMATFVFAGWEWFVALRTGESHFLFHLFHTERAWPNVALLPEALLTIPGAVAPMLIVLGMLGLRCPGHRILTAACLVAAIYLLVAFAPDAYSKAEWGDGDGSVMLSLTCGCYVVSGGVLFGILAQVARRLLRPGETEKLTNLRREALFLTLWLLVEIVGYFALSPFSAVRRLLGVLVVATLLLGRLASRTCRSRPARRKVWAVSLCGVLLGLLFYVVDLRDAVAQKEAAERAAEQIRQAGGNVWYVGHWGFQFYAERAGMRALVPEESEPQPGDWLVVLDKRCAQQQITIPEGAVEEVEPLLIEDCLPLRTVRQFYGGVMPLEHLEGPRVIVRLYRVVRRFRAELRQEPTARHVGPAEAKCRAVFCSPRVRANALSCRQPSQDAG
jgi:hypothetical protein